MHKQTPVVEINLDEQTSSIAKIGEIHDGKHVPIGIEVKKGKVNRASLNEWWRSRSIPASRDGIREALEKLNIIETEKLLEKSLGLSLSDQYWICPKGSDIKWVDVNFFDNTFSEDVGNILIGFHTESEEISLMSPDNTSDGWLKKKWTIVNGKRCLIKGGSGATQQEPYNEVFASKICERLGIHHIPYSLMKQEEYPYSVCENFVTSNTELISAWYVMQTEKKQNHVSVYQHYLNCCNDLGIPNIEESINQMLVLDYLVMNEDRHQYNFGVIRNAENLEWLGASPVFDSGTSLWYSKPVSLIHADGKINCKPFKNNHEDQIKLVTDFDWVDLSSLKNIEEEYREIVKDSLFVDEARTDAICFAFCERVTMLQEVINDKSRNHYFAGLDTTSDVKKDIKNSGHKNLEKKGNKFKR
ncbi:HipA domain-containing protein [Bacillus sp. SD088]|nr:HipA domain-containing protein [Bacillus sp. SD088]